MSESLNNTRQRPSSPYDQEPVPAVHSEVWYYDGNIILQAENIPFRLHRSVLSSRSGVFSNLFGIPPSAEEFFVEGCSVVQLHDSAEDVKHMAQAVYGDKLVAQYTRMDNCIFIFLCLNKAIQFSQFHPFPRPCGYDSHGSQIYDC